MKSKESVKPITPTKPERKKQNGTVPQTIPRSASGATIARNPRMTASWRKQVSFEDQLLREETARVRTPTSTPTGTVERVSKVKKQKTRGYLNRGRSLDNVSSSESDVESQQSPVKPPRRKNKNRNSGSGSEDQPVKLKGILKKQSSLEKQSDDSLSRRRLTMRRGSSVDSALPPLTKFNQKVTFILYLVLHAFLSSLQYCDFRKFWPNRSVWRH